MQGKSTLAERIARFWNRFDRSGGPDACWPWIGASAREGYGVNESLTDLGVGRLTHRQAYRITYGKLRRKQLVCHHCDNPPCGNPDHLFKGSHRDNTQDARRKGRLAIGAHHGTKTRPERVHRGEGHYRTRLTDTQIEEIERRGREANHRPHQRDGLCSSLAKEFNVSLGTVSNILSGHPRGRGRGGRNYGGVATRV
jgi:hypothetical protein